MSACRSGSLSASCAVIYEEFQVDSRYHKLFPTPLRGPASDGIHDCLMVISTATADGLGIDFVGSVVCGLCFGDGLSTTCSALRLPSFAFGRPPPCCSLKTQKETRDEWASDAYLPPERHGALPKAPYAGCPRSFRGPPVLGNQIDIRHRPLQYDVLAAYPRGLSKPHPRISQQADQPARLSSSSLHCALCGLIGHQGPARASSRRLLVHINPCECAILRARRSHWRDVAIGFDAVQDSCTELPVIPRFTAIAEASHIAPSLHG